MAITNKVALNFRKDVSAGSNVFLDLQNATLVDDNKLPTRDFAPPTHVVLFNTSDASLKVYLNQQVSYRDLPANSILELEDEQVSQIKVVNDGSVNGSVSMRFDNEQTQLSLLKLIASKL